MSISKREKTLLFIVFVLALIGGYYMFYLKPCIEDIQSTNTEIGSLELQKAAAEQQNTQYEQLQTQIDGLDAQLSLYGGEITHTMDQPAVLVYLSDTISQHATKNTISFEATEQTGGLIERYAIDATMVTTYDGLKQLISALEDSPYLMRISGLILSTGEEITVIPADNETGTSGTDTATSDTTTDTSTNTNISVDAAQLQMIAVEMNIDFYCLPEPIPDDTIYSFDTPRQYGGDIFY